MKLAACYCEFRRVGMSPDVPCKWEPGIAITTTHGLADVVAIFAADATAPIDALPGNYIYDYRLDWTHSLYPPANP